MILRIGTKGELVKNLQVFLEITADGDFGPKTHAAVVAWQKGSNLTPDGIVGPKTWAAMAIATTDSSEIVENITPALSIKEHFLPTGEYLPGPTPKQWLFLHHTAGWHNPYNVINDWGCDSRGAVATEFVIGGQSIRGTDSHYDGEVVSALPEGAYGWHLGIGNNEMHRNSVGIETCCFGQLVKGGYSRVINGNPTWVTLHKSKYYTYVGTEAHNEQVVSLKEPFRGSIYWHRYSSKQIASLRELILFIANRDSIDVRKGLPQLIRSKGADAFNTIDMQMVRSEKGLWCHSNVSSGKMDMFPQQELMDMLLSL